MKKLHIIILMLLIHISVFIQPPRLENANNFINVVDTILISQYYGGIYTSPFYVSAASVNCDNLDIKKHVKYKEN